MPRSDEMKGHTKKLLHNLVIQKVFQQIEKLHFWLMFQVRDYKRKYADHLSLSHIGKIGKLQTFL